MKTFIPQLRVHQSGHYTVRIKGKDYYLGKDKNKAKTAYNIKIAEYLQNTDISQAVKFVVTPTVNQVVIHWYDTIQKTGRQKNFCEVARYALRVLISVAGEVPIDQFGKRHFREVKAAMLKTNLKMKTLNERLRAMKRFFDWVYDNEIIGDLQHHAISTVRLFSKNEADFPQSERILPVPVEVVYRTLPFLSPTIADMVCIQLLTGTRAQDVCNMTSEEIDKSGKVWMYRPSNHKTSHIGKTRVIAISPGAQKILLPYIEAIQSKAPLFSPIRSEKKRKEERRAMRKSKVQPSQVDRSKEMPKRKPGIKYTTDSYGRAIRRGCEKAVKAGILLPTEIWHSHQLRHTAGTLARELSGLDAAQAFLGHSSAKITERYAEIAGDKAAEVALQIDSLIESRK